MLFSRPNLKAQEVTDDWQTLMSWLGISSGEVNVAGKNSLKEITVFTCIKILSDTLSKLPLKMYQESNGIKKATNHYLYPLLKLRPNPFMSASDFWKCVEVQRNIDGNAYVWLDIAAKGRNAGKIQGLYPLDSSNMRIFVDDVGLLSSRNSIWYVYTDGQGSEYRINPDELLHFKGLTTNGIVGLNPIETLRNSIENAKSSEQFLNNSYKNGMQTKGIVQYVGELNPSAEDAFRRNFERMSNGLKNANKISLLPLGYQFQPISLKMTDAQFLENAQLTIRQISAAYGVKLHQLNDLQKASYASTSEQNREFYVDTLMAILTMYEQELTYKLFLSSELEDGYYSKFNVDVILRGDPKTRYETYAVAIQNGIKSPNECRALEEDEPKAGGDQLIVNGNFIPLTKVGMQYTKGGEE